MLKTLFILVVWMTLSVGNAAQHRSTQVPDNCEGNSARLDVVRNKSQEANKSKYTIVIARLGRGEQSQEINRRRLYTIQKYLTAMGLPSQRLITAEGERVQGYGRVELYVGGELVELLAIERNKDLPVGICDNDSEDRIRYQLPRRSNAHGYQ